MEKILCALCDSDDHETLETRARYELKATTVICKNCGLVFLNPRMTFGEYEKFYSSSKYRKLYSSMESPTKELDERSLRGAEEKFAFFEKNINLSKFKNKTFLDIGCSAGYLPFVFKKNGWDAEGIEPTKSFAEHGRKKFGVKIRTGLLEKEIYKKKYSFITLVHVFEHLTEPHTALQKLRKMLTANGLLYIEVPNVQEFYGRFEQSCDAAHPYFYSPETLTAILRSNGFEVFKSFSGSAIRIFAKTGKKKLTKISDYARTKEILKRRRRNYYIKGYFIFTPIYERSSRAIANNPKAAAAFKKFAKVYSKSRLPFSRALKELGAVDE